MGPGAIKERFRRVPTEVAEERGRTKAAFEEIVTLAPRFLESTRWINYTSATLSSLLVERADRGFALPLVQRAIEAFHLGSGEPLKVSASISKEPYSPREEIRIGKGTRDPFSKPKVKIEFNGSSFKLGTVSDQQGFVATEASSFATNQNFLTQLFDIVGEDLRIQRKSWADLLRADRDAYSLEIGRTVHQQAPVYIESLLDAMRHISPGEKFAVFGAPADRRGRDLPLIRLLTSMEFDEKRIDRIDGFYQTHRPFGYRTTRRDSGRNDFQRRYDRDYQNSSGFLPYGLDPQNYWHYNGTYTLTFPDFAISLERLTLGTLYDLATTSYSYSENSFWRTGSDGSDTWLADRLFARFLEKGKDEEIYPVATRKKITLLTVQPNSSPVGEIFDKPLMSPKR